jgi:hypothetical protein
MCGLLLRQAGALANCAILPSGHYCRKTGICPTPTGQWTLNWKDGGYNESRSHKKQRKNAEHIGKLPHI